MNPDVPGGEVGSEEEGGEGDQQRQFAARPMDRLASHCGDHEQEWERERQAPKSGCDGAYPGQPHQPRTEGEGSASDKDGRKGETVGMAGH